MKKYFAIVCYTLALLTFLDAEEPSDSDAPSEFQVNLKDPVFTSGVLRTDQGGIITAPGLRIQAQSVEYTNKIENGHVVQKVVAQGDLMMEYQGRAFVGDKLEFNLVSRTGYLTNGKTFVDAWFLGGDKIELKEDGSYIIYGGYITTCESQDNTWEIRVDRLKITPGNMLSAKDIRFRLINIPIFWLPKLTSNLKFLKDPPIRYKITWDKSLGPRFSMRYRIYSWEEWNVFLRFDLRTKIARHTKFGPGGALETDYHSKDERTVFLTKTYGAYDKIFPNERGNKRYRLQGLLTTTSQDQKTHFHLQWDKLSDHRMVSDFKSEDFEINTEKMTFLTLTHWEDRTFARLIFHPRVNRFDTLKQQLPTTCFGIRPFNLWNTGIILENHVNLANLDYTYATALDQKRLRTRRSGRFEGYHEAYRPIKAGPVNIIPRIGLHEIFYTNSPDRHQIGQLVFQYGGEINSRLYRNYEHFQHLIQPYARYFGLSRPQAALYQHFIFDINDGYQRLDQLRVGMQHVFYSFKKPAFLPFLEMDLYTYAFMGAHSFHKTVPKLYIDSSIHVSHYTFNTHLCWNFDHQVLDYSNFQLLWTLSEDAALGCEFRHRSRYVWRKADHENYVVDFARSLHDLLESPMSDKRNTLLTKVFLRFSQDGTCFLNPITDGDVKPKGITMGSNLHFIA